MRAKISLPLVLLVSLGAALSACSSSSLKNSGGGPTDGSAADLVASRDLALATPDLRLPGAPPAVDGGALCAERKGGALITIDTASDGQIVLWITDSQFIDESIVLQLSGDSRTAMFGRVIAEPDCDATHAWHVDPAQAGWTDSATEECEVSVNYVTTHLGAWVGRLNPNWCPSPAAVTAVQDRR